ncbi:hypothetical protein [Methylotetracoccus oryzae]|uniref:hypothetical protein n=1 Tax=Methylotetracoccus oryzae TaxID=1919059 RepID=UPI00111A0D17|nr:hypothetical protein [Methylotetracoccus oryzae]
MNASNARLLVLDEATEKVILQHMDDFKGLGTTLESALGALVIGQYFGWRVLKLVHNPATYRQYEKVLGIEFKDVCDPITEAGERKSVGYAITKALKSFWAVIMGKHSVPAKGQISDADAVAQEVERHVAAIEAAKERGVPS